MADPLYPKVNIVNSTEYAVSGTVTYSICSPDSYHIDKGPGTSWTGPSRGACLLTEISAWVTVGSDSVYATPYTSSGTSYSEFAVIQLNKDPTFQVTRRISADSETNRNSEETVAAA
jgi:hypothetical protein